ncbi:MAG: protoporphyrinogen oxidase [Candidatus Obscuribacterales bacterium]|jgi:oxygen-dependent protoporphyrinogen oxidase|nr:protoporphyrinogen oxidase [Candidatus Obscuribacterales bacterium]
MGLYFQLRAGGFAMNERRIVIIGAGITGLSAAFFLKKSLADSVKILLLESSDRIGGVIGSIQKDDALMEIGPEAFLSIKPQVMELAKELGIIDRLKRTNPESRGSLIVHSRKMFEIPEGFVLFAPTQIGPCLRTNLFSFFGKLRMGFDLIIPRRKKMHDESVADFVRRRLGKEALDRLAQPLITAIYGGDIERLSSASVVPQMVQLEQLHRSIILGLLGTREQRGIKTVADKDRSLFMSFDKGMSVLIEALSKHLPDDCLYLNKSISSVVPKGKRQWLVQCSNGESILADAVIICTPGPVASKILAVADSKIAEELDSIKAPLAMTVNLLYHKSSIKDELDAFGFIVPEQDKSAIRACTFSSTKFAGRASNNTKLLRVFLSEECRTALWDKPDYEIAKFVTSSLRRYIQITGLPIDFHVARHLNGIPEYNVGHKDRVEQIFLQLNSLPGLYLAGNSYSGIGISECIASAREAVRKVNEYLSDDTCLKRLSQPAEA